MPTAGMTRCRPARSPAATRRCIGSCWRCCDRRTVERTAALPGPAGLAPPLNAADGPVIRARIMPIDRTQPLTAPRIYLVRMGLFLVVAGFLVFILHRPIWTAFLANPGLNGLIGGVLLIGAVLAVRQVSRLFREVRWVNALGRGRAQESETRPVLLAPMAALMANRLSRIELSVVTTRSLLDSVAARLDENREIVRYLAGLLVFLGLLGTFWGLIETVGSIGRIIASLRTGGDAAVLF